MPYTNKAFTARAEEYQDGRYFVIRYPGGGFEVRSPDWPSFWEKERGLVVPSDSSLREKYFLQTQNEGGIKDSLGNKIAARGLLECGKFSRVAGRQALDLPAGTNYGSMEHSKSTVYNYWHPRKTKAGFFTPRKNVTKNITEFMHDEPKAYKYIASHGEGIANTFESWYPGMYREVSTRRVRTDSHSARKEIADILIDRFNKGLAIAPTALKFSTDEREKELYRRVLDLAEKDLVRKEAYTEIVTRLTRLPVKSFSLGGIENKARGELTEEFTEFLFFWSSLVGTDTWGVDSSNWISSKRKDLAFLHGDTRYEADLRVGDKAIEVKTGIGKLSEETGRILLKYGNHGVWENTGEDVKKGAIIFHKRQKLYANLLPAIKEAGLTVVSYADFHDRLGLLINEMKERPKMYRDVRPITSLDTLLDLHQEVSLNPYLLVREENKARRQWVHHILISLIERAKELRTQKFIGGKEHVR